MKYVYILHFYIERDDFLNRIDNRACDELRQIKITKNYTKYAEGSVLIEVGETKVLCNASIEEKVPPFLKNTGSGWITAEYSMLPRATQTRKIRESSRGKIEGRTQEIQRLIGRALRSVIDLKKLGERTIWIDCDVIQADGGTRTAAITGAFIALADAVLALYNQKKIKKMPIKSFIAATSVGIYEGQKILDLCYEEDSKAQVDMNIIMTDKLEFVELQGTAEGFPFKRHELNELIDLGQKGNLELINKQKEVLKELLDILKPKTEVVVATSNAHKLSEIGKILSDFDVKILSMKSVGLSNLEIVEDGETFEENAFIKAREVAKRTGKITIADDSGLCVDALGGSPGIYSARFSGENANDEKNNNKLLKLMDMVKGKNRTAKFVSAIGVVFPNGEEFSVRGECFGKIGYEKVGSNGFGYDPLFIVDGMDKTFAQLSSDEKNKISHRSKSLEKMREEFKKRLKK